MTASAISPHFSPYQLKVLNLLSQVDNEQQMNEICDLLSNYFAQKAIEAADQLWDAGQIDVSTVESWKHEHMRTQY